MRNEKIRLVKITFYDNEILYIDIERVVGWLKISSKKIVKKERSENFTNGTCPTKKGENKITDSVCLKDEIINLERFSP
jgi:hypothetical protein